MTTWNDMLHLVMYVGSTPLEQGCDSLGLAIYCWSRVCSIHRPIQMPTVMPILTKASKRTVLFGWCIHTCLISWRT